MRRGSSKSHSSALIMMSPLSNVSQRSRMRKWFCSDRKDDALMRAPKHFSRGVLSLAPQPYLVFIRGVVCSGELHLENLSAQEWSPALCRGSRRNPLTINIPPRLRVNSTPDSILVHQRCYGFSSLRMLCQHVRVNRVTCAVECSCWLRCYKCCVCCHVCRFKKTQMLETQIKSWFQS